MVMFVVANRGSSHPVNLYGLALRRKVNTEFITTNTSLAGLTSHYWKQARRPIFQNASLQSTVGLLPIADGSVASVYLFPVVVPIAEERSFKNGVTGTISP